MAVRGCRDGPDVATVGPMKATRPEGTLDLPPTAMVAGGVLAGTHAAEQLAEGSGHVLTDGALLVAGISFAMSGALRLRDAWRRRRAVRHA